MADDLELAVAHHRGGRLAQAAQLYRKVLVSRPDHADALHLLGVIASQQGDNASAVQWISRAITCNPAVPVYYTNLAEVCRSLGQIERAIALCQTALRLQPEYPEAANALGLLLMARGDFPAAIDQFRAALRMRPDFALAYNNLGTVLRFRGNIAAALACFQQAVQLDPNQAEARSNLGQMLLEDKRPDEALIHCREAVRLRPNFAEAQGNLGNVLRDLGQLTEAKVCYLEALHLNPKLAMLYNNMGLALQEEADLDGALSWYERGLQVDPNLACLSCHLASVLAEKERHDEAIARYEFALRLDPNYAEAHNGIGWVRHEQGRHDEARQAYQTALQLKPDLAAAHTNLGMTLEELADMQGAERCFREALRHDPRFVPGHGQLAGLLRGKLPDEDLAAIRKLLADPDLPDGKRSALSFGMGQVLDARKDYAEAAEFMRQANALAILAWRKRGQVYDAPAHQKVVEQTVAAFTPAYFERVRGFGVESERPVFIIGLPRSGTTLTEQILASHSQVFGAGELRLIWHAFANLASEECDRFTALTRSDRETVQRLSREHLEELRKLNPDKVRVVDKMPDNYLYLGLIATMFPRAKIIHCRRDLRDVALSCWMTGFRHIRWANDPECIVGRFQGYRQVMDHWQRVLPMPLLEVDYEETVEDLEGVARRLVAWCGLDWEPACLNFHEGNRPVRTASVTQVRQPIYKRSVARWKHYEPALRELFARLEELGAPRRESAS